MLDKHAKSTVGQPMEHVRRTYFVWGQTMKTMSMNHSAASGTRADLHAGNGLFAQLRAVSRKLACGVRRQDGVFAAIGLAENGDVEGATELYEQIRRDQS
jgi:hypothetical protein